MTPTLTTNRLILAPLQLKDAEQVQLLFPEWEIVKYITAGVPWPYPPDGAYRYYRDLALPAMARGDSWHWTLRLKNAPEQIIGSIALMRSEIENRGFWIGKPWQCQGFMTEASDAVTDYWFNVLGFPVLRVPKAVANIASRRISEKCGMRVIGREERDYVSGRHPAEIWEITAEEWQRYRKSKLLSF